MAMEHRVLTEEEAVCVQRLADELCGTGDRRLDDPVFVIAARLACEELPSRFAKLCGRSGASRTRREACCWVASR